MTQEHHQSNERVFQRARGIEIVPVSDGYVAYDDLRGLVHYLNPTAAIVLELCELCADEAEIAGRMQVLFALPAPPDVEVDACLAQLRDQMLILRG